MVFQRFDRSKPSFFRSNFRVFCTLGEGSDLVWRPFGVPRVDIFDFWTPQNAIEKTLFFRFGPICFTIFDEIDPVQIPQWFVSNLDHFKRSHDQNCLIFGCPFGFQGVPKWTLEFVIFYQKVHFLICFSFFSSLLDFRVFSLNHSNYCAVGT